MADNKYKVKVGDAEYLVTAPDANTAWQWANMTHQQESTESTAKPTDATAPSGKGSEMPIRAQSADGQIHEFPAGTSRSIIDKVMLEYAQSRLAAASLTQTAQPTLSTTEVPTYHTLSSPPYAGHIQGTVAIVVVIAIISFAIFKTLNRLVQDAATVAERDKEARAEQERAKTEEARREQADQGRADKAQSEKAQAEAQQEKARPWYEVLGVNKNASHSDVTSAYRALIAKYHPDKLSGLGEEFQTIAELKSREINNAYAAYKQQRG